MSLWKPGLVCQSTCAASNAAQNCTRHGVLCFRWLAMSINYKSQANSVNNQWRVQYRTRRCEVGRAVLAFYRPNNNYSFRCGWLIKWMCPKYCSMLNLGLGNTEFQTYRFIILELYKLSTSIGPTYCRLSRPLCLYPTERVRSLKGREDWGL